MGYICYFCHLATFDKFGMKNSKTLLISEKGLSVVLNGETVLAEVINENEKTTNYSLQLWIELFQLP